MSKKGYLKKMIKKYLIKNNGKYYCEASETWWSTEINKAFKMNINEASLQLHAFDNSTTIVEVETKTIEVLQEVDYE